MESEFLERISHLHRVFLTRTAVLGRMSGPLCEAVLELPGSAATLTDLARSNLLLVPLDRRGQWYRYHHLFRDMLLAELERLEPGLMPVLRRRAASWCLRNDRPEEALEYSIAAEDVDTVSRLVQSLGLPTYRQGRVATLQQWYQWLDERGGMARHPVVAAQAALIAADTGRPAEAERWADVVDRWQYQDAARADDPVAEAWATVARAVLCRRGVKQMGADADEAVQRLTAANIAVPVAGLCQGIARILSGDLEGGDASLEDTASAAEKAVPTRSSRWRWANGRCWPWRAVTGARPRPSPDKPAPCCAGPGWRTSSLARCKPAQPCTGEMSRRPASSWSALSGYGPW